MLHVIPQILASLTNPMPEFRLGLVIDHRATGHPGQKFRHIRADTGNPRQRSAMTAQLSHQTRQNLGERICNAVVHQPLSQHRRLIPDIPARFRCPVNPLHRPPGDVPPCAHRAAVEDQSQATTIAYQV
jgi:hypothetical protein